MRGFCEKSRKCQPPGKATARFTPQQAVEAPRYPNINVIPLRVHAEVLSSRILEQHSPDSVPWHPSTGWFSRAAIGPKQETKKTTPPKNCDGQVHPTASSRTLPQLKHRRNSNPGLTPKYCQVPIWESTPWHVSRSSPRNRPKNAGFSPEVEFSNSGPR
jgi:hypothetical protein